MADSFSPVFPRFLYFIVVVFLIYQYLFGEAVCLCFTTTTKNQIVFNRAWRFAYYFFIAERKINFERINVL